MEYPRIKDVSRAAQLDELLGPIVHRSSSFLVRCLDRENGNIVVSIHRVIDGKEVVPGTWVNGINKCTFDLLKAR